MQSLVADPRPAQSQKQPRTLPCVRPPPRHSFDPRDINHRNIRLRRGRTKPITSTWQQFVKGVVHKIPVPDFDTGTPSIASIDIIRYRTLVWHIGHHTVD